MSAVEILMVWSICWQGGHTRSSASDREALKNIDVCCIIPIKVDNFKKCFPHPKKSPIHQKVKKRRLPRKLTIINYQLDTNYYYIMSIFEGFPCVNCGQFYIRCPHQQPNIRTAAFLPPQPHQRRSQLQSRTHGRTFCRQQWHEDFNSGCLFTHVYLMYISTHL